MKIIISEQQLSQLSEGPIGYDLAKDIRKYQLKKYPNQDKNLESIFGKNVYRLYYNIETGQQIFPTRKTPSLKFNTQEPKDKLKNDITKVLEYKGYNLVNMEKNIAKNVKTGQTVKATKILNNIDNDTLIRYNEFLDSLTRATNEGNLFAVISRHPYDISNMGSYENFQSCMDLSGIKSIKDTSFGTRYGAEGAGTYAEDMFDSQAVIFYLIKENDWNIQDPLARFAEGIYCVSHSSVYGKSNPKFVNFITQWLNIYYSEIIKISKKNTPNDIESKTDYEIADIYSKAERHEIPDILRNIIINKKYSALRKIIDKNTYIIHRIVTMLGYEIIKTFPQELKDHITKTAMVEYKEYLHNVDIILFVLNSDTEKLKEFDINVIQNLYQNSTYKLKTNKYNSINSMIKVVKYINPEEYSKILAKYKTLLNKDGLFNHEAGDELLKSTEQKLKQTL